MRAAELSGASSSCRMIPKVVVSASCFAFLVTTSVSLSKVTYAEWRSETQGSCPLPAISPRRVQRIPFHNDESLTLVEERDKFIMQFG